MQNLHARTSTKSQNNDVLDAEIHTMLPVAWSTSKLHGKQSLYSIVREEQGKLGRGEVSKVGPGSGDEGEAMRQNRREVKPGRQMTKGMPPIEHTYYMSPSDWY